MTLLLGDCIERMRELPEASVDAVVTDPPYGIAFMGNHWDRFDIERRVGARDQLGPHHWSTVGTGRQKTRSKSAFANDGSAAGSYDLSARGNRAFQAWTEAWAVEAFRLLKPGGHLLSFAGTRTYHRMACGVEDAGFEIRDTLAWLFGSGFPKNLDVAKAIDKAADYRLQSEFRRAYVQAVEAAGLELPTNSRHDWTKAEHAPGDKWWAEFCAWLPTLADVERDRVERAVVGFNPRAAGWFARQDGHSITAPASQEAVEWEGWGTALKPAFEPIVVARKPLVGTVAANVSEHGTGALNVAGCKIEGQPHAGGEHAVSIYGSDGNYEPGPNKPGNEDGRWPANVVLDEAAAAMLDQQTGELSPGSVHSRGTGLGYHGANGDRGVAGVLDAGGASRFFYCAKVSRAEREAGMEPSLFSPHSFPEQIADPYAQHRGRRMENQSHPSGNPPAIGRNNHPTVKPLALMRWLIRLVTPPGGTVLDPFLGSGSTAAAAALEGCRCIGIEAEAAYMRIAEARVSYWSSQPTEAVA